jgi:putative chitinase
MIIDRKRFYDDIRANFYGGVLTQVQVDEINVALDTWERTFGAEKGQGASEALADAWIDAAAEADEDYWVAVMKQVCPQGRTDLRDGFARQMPQLIVEFGLSGALRQAHFIAQCAHESDNFRTFEEYASGSAYEGRKDLGNTQPGDGVKFKGRGPIQLTGRANYTGAGRALGVDLVSRPELAKEFPLAPRIAGWFWSTRNINPHAERDDIQAVTRIINGGLNGLDSRQAYLSKAKTALA